jgi:RNA polymerase sigma-70 factor (ECF subfamily)
MKPEFRLIEGSANEKSTNLPTEEELIRAAQSGDTAAFQELYDHYRDRVYSLIYYSLNDAHQVEDALQTVFVKVFQALPFFRLESSFLTWIYRVALNECKNRRRRQKLFVSMNEIRNGGLEEPGPGPAPDSLHESRQIAQQVRIAVMALKPKYRQVVILKYLEELSYEEVAAVVGCSAGTVASRLYRALQILEAKLRSSGYKKEVLR